MRILIPSLTVLALLLSGCAAETGNTNSDPKSPRDEPTAPNPVTSETTGAVYGLVTDDTDYPLANVTILLQREGTDDVLYALTHIDGTFSYSQVAPGIYRIDALRLGFHATAQKIEVQAQETRHVRLTLISVPIPVGHYDTKILNGKTTCTVSVRTPVNYVRPSCRTVIASDTYHLAYDLKPGFVDLLVETNWRPTYTYGNQLLQTSFGFISGTLTVLKDLEAPPILRLEIPHAEWVAWDEAHGSDYSQYGGRLGLSTFAAHNILTSPSPVHFGMVIDQSFTVYSTSSFNQTIPEGFSVVPDEGVEEPHAQGPLAKA
jgi:hypothetical protein